MKRLLILILSMALLLSAAGCTVRGEPAPVPTETPAQPTQTLKPAVQTPSLPEKPTETKEPEPTEEPLPTEEPEPAFRSPFNGAPLEEQSTVRPFAVMLNNLDKALPQCGNGQADIIYECLAEGGITRMIGIYSDIENVGKLGPVRSIRPYFIDIALSYGAVIGHAGGSDAAYSRIRNEKLNNIDGVRGAYNFNVFYRDPDRLWAGYEHALFTTGADLYKCAQELKYDFTVGEDYDSGLRFTKDGTPDSEDAASVIEVTFSSFKTTTLFYDEESGLYSAVEYKQDYVDGNTGDNVTFRNFIAVYAGTKVLDSYGRLDVNLISEGRGYFACGGKFIPITWQRGSSDDCFHYYLEDGSELQLGVGTSYIAVLAENQGKVLFS